MGAVSYTHLDVYKRQLEGLGAWGPQAWRCGGWQGVGVGRGHPRPMR
ncbi:hypothetical protein [Streptomyces fragilis]|nr:hypothetical protein [Streptomyces fragilis]